MPKGGWGMSDILSDLLSREPAAVPANDLEQLTSNLVNEGYLRPDTAIDATWNDQKASAFARMERDAEEQARSGQAWGAAPVQAVWRFMGNTVPSAVYEATIGAAKGMIEQAPETAERMGAAGGALYGAGLGAVAAGGPGAIVGGVVGAATGFLSDLFGEEPGEEGQTQGQKVVDALSPAEEYFGTDKDQYLGPKALFEDLGLVASAALLLKGGMSAVGAARVGIKAIGETGLKAALTKTGTTTPGLLARGVGKVLPEKAATPWMDFMTSHGLRAVGSRPLFQTAKQAYTGIAAGSLGARYAAGAAGGEGKTTIEQAISETDAGTAGTVADWTLGLVLNPARFTPWEKGAVAKGAQKLLATPGKDLFRIGKDLNEHMSGVAMRAYVHLATKYGKTGTKMGSVRDRISDATSALGETADEQARVDGWLRLDAGIKWRAEEIVHDAGITPLDEGYGEALKRAVFDLKRGIKEETEAQGVSDTAKDLVQRTHSVTTDTGQQFDTSLQFARFLEDLEGTGSGLDRVTDWVWANRRVQRLMNEGGEVQLARTEDAATFGVPRELDRIQAEGFAKNLRKQADDALKRADEAPDFRSADAARKEADQLKAMADDVEWEAGHKVRNEIPKEGAGWVAVPARLETITRAEMNAIVRQLERVDEKIQIADKAVRKINAPTKTSSGPIDDTLQREAWWEAKQDRDLLIEELRNREVLPDAIPPDMIGYLKRKAELAPLELNVPQGIKDEFAARGYKLVGTPDTMFFLDDLPGFIGKHDIGDYTKRAGFFETLGVSPFKFKDQDIVNLRAMHDRNEIGQILQEEGIELPSRYAFQRLQAKLTSMTRTFDEGGEVKNVSKLQRVTRKTAEGEVKEWGLRVERRQLSTDDIGEALRLDELMPGASVDDIERVKAKLQRALKRGAAFGGETSMGDPIERVRMLGKAMRINGLSGFSDFIRTLEVGEGRFGMMRAPAIGGAIVGGGAGAEEGGVTGGLKGAAIGAATGAGFGKFLTKVPKFAKGTYGYLPDKLFNLNMLLRYSLSPTFDAGRYVEQYTLGKMKGDLPFMINPEKYIDKRAGELGGDMRAAMNYWDNLTGSKVTQTGDDLERRLNTIGFLGFNPRKYEAAQAFLLSKRLNKSGTRVYSDDEIFELVSEIGRYGLGRTASEKTVNFVFFPFSFQKKLLLSLGDFINQSPGRNLLLHESFRRYYEAGENPSLSERVNDMTERYAPLVDSLRYLNNLSQGASPGRFVLDGLAENDTDAAKMTQVLASVFVPSGAATPIAQTAGGLTDAAIHLFSPVVIAGESRDDVSALRSFVDEFDRYLPLFRDLQKYADALDQQVTVAREGEAPYAQLQDYFDEKREAKAEYEGMAAALGYDSVDNFLRSDVGAQLAGPTIEAKEFELGQKYPSGFRMAKEYTDIEGINEQLIYNLADKPRRSKAEDEVLAIAQMIEGAKSYAELLDISQDDAIALQRGAIRERAMTNYEDSDFRPLWERLFAWQFGPLAQMKAGMTSA